MSEQQPSTSSSYTFPSTSTSATTIDKSKPIITVGSDWTKNLVELAKTAELKKHALSLQLHTAHILSAHASLEQKSKAIQDIKEQRNKLESERSRLLNCLRQVNDDRDQVSLACDELRKKVTGLTADNGDYATAKVEVDRLRQELGQPPLPSIQNTLDEKASQYLTSRRLNGNAKRIGSPSSPAVPQKRPRGRPKGSKTRKNIESS
ncbi:hypothetical protein FISHEDRAFT_46278 [Fistulina hepatica ATCC 64428]|uniref:Uncharacterized protein n=1 Tax=Fistulina hepatica ATCC 64428 TaxID=1128425 RepID=A0A0D7A9B0_9AGAR|nr:hypothetical protein FISHEDRAFT_46278 [Fistulina hepatica ATCC 64428]